jgi:hypothetical protein
MIISKMEALISLRPGAAIAIYDDVIEWNDTEQTQPTDAEVTTELARLQALADASQYQRDRTYPTLAEQADMQYWDALNGTTTWQDAITAVKAEFPKTTGA